MTVSTTAHGFLGAGRRYPRSAIRSRSLRASRLNASARGGRETEAKTLGQRGRACFAPALVGLLAVGCGGGHSLTTTGRLASVGPAAGRTAWFGPQVGADALANTRIGGPGGTTLAFRFRSTWSGVVTGVRFYIVVNNGSVGEYSGGDGGTLRVTLVAGGKGGIPTAKPLASVELHPKISAISFPFARFANPPPILAGHEYDVVFTNTSPHPTENWISVNALISSRAGVPPPPIPLAGSVLLGDSTDGGATPTNWRRRAQTPDVRYLPIVDIAGARSGQHLGLGYMESWISNPKPIGGAAAVRELFTYRRAAARLVEARVRLRRIGSDDGSVGMRLERPDGTLLAESAIPAARVPSETAGWVSVVFSTPPLLHPGERVALVLRSKHGSFEAFPLRKGSAFGFDRSTVFADGYAQYTQDGGWTGWDQWDKPNRADGDLQLAMRLQR